MKRPEELEQLVLEVWPTEPMALDVLHVVLTIDDHVIHHITIPLIVQLVDDRRGEPPAKHAGDKGMLAAVYRFVTYLASERMGLLASHFELLRDNDELEELDQDAVIAAFETGELHDPVTGYEVVDWEQHVVPYYSATDLLKEIRRDRT